MAAILDFRVKMANIWKSNPWNGFLTSELVKNLLKIADFSKSKMAASGHFGFWPLLGLAHTFARGIGAQFFSNTSKYPNPLSNLPLLSVVTGGPNMTLLSKTPFGDALFETGDQHVLFSQNMTKMDYFESILTWDDVIVCWAKFSAQFSGIKH